MSRESGERYPTISGTQLQKLDAIAANETFAERQLAIDAATVRWTAFPNPNIHDYHLERAVENDDPEGLEYYEPTPIQIHRLWEQTPALADQRHVWNEQISGQDSRTPFEQLDEYNGTRTANSRATQLLAHITGSTEHYNSATYRNFGPRFANGRASKTEAEFRQNADPFVGGDWFTDTEGKTQPEPNVVYGQRQEDEQQKS